ncbi:hypothetical protein CBG18_08810 [Limosilactobacillus reuteri]|uniref:hypothetical protein n=1 Tax=Limosilactobacillus reuteri TaxID=1598 RepID=UPI000B984A29|nr:hypothetical protein [Limosilactobacillus reuteri]OYS88771.1 hypothetical protein CBG18_08810 [Limosilactobacillus reuteri]
MNYIERAEKLILLITFKKHDQQITIPQEFFQEESDDIKLSIDDHRILITGNLQLCGLLQPYTKNSRYILDNNEKITFFTYGLGIQGVLENTSEINNPVNIGSVLNVFPAITDKFSDNETTSIGNFDISFTSELNGDELVVSIRSERNKISLFSAISHDTKKGKDSNDMNELYKKALNSFKNLVNQEEVDYDC